MSLSRVHASASRCSESESRSVVSDSSWPLGLYSPWNSLGQNTGVVVFSPLQGIFPTQGLSSGLPHCRQILSQLSHQGSSWYRSGPHLNLKTWEAGEPAVEVPVLVQGRNNFPAQEQSGRDHSRLSRLLFYSGPQWVDKVHPHWGGQSALVSLPIQILISSRNTFTGTPRIKLTQLSGHSMASQVYTWHSPSQFHSGNHLPSYCVFWYELLWC